MKYKSRYNYRFKSIPLLELVLEHCVVRENYMQVVLLIDTEASVKQFVYGFCLKIAVTLKMPSLLIPHQHSYDMKTAFNLEEVK